MSWNESSNDILEAIQANPKLPIRFMVDSQEIVDDYYTLHEQHQVEVTEICQYNGRIYAGCEVVMEDILDDLWGESDIKKWEDAKPQLMPEAERIYSELKKEQCILIWTGA